MFLKYFIIVVLFGACVVYAQNKCCSGERNILAVGKCIDGKNITGILCSKRYLLESETTENFTISPDGSLIDEDTSIPVKGYCLSSLKRNGTTSIVALVCFSGDQFITESDDIFFYRAASASISVIFLIATIIVYILVPSLRDLQGKCLMHSISCLGLAMLVLCILQFGVIIPEEGCHVIGYIAYAAFLATFTWLNVISFHIWRTTVIPTMLGTNKQWHLIYCVYGYGIPTTIVLTAIIGHHTPGDHIKPGIGEQGCWLRGRDAIWAYFYGPIAFLLVVNVMLFIWTVKTLWKDMGNSNNTAKIRSMKYKCRLYIKLFFVMGLSWIFEVLSFAFPHQGNFLSYIWLVTDFLNALQGVLIFLILVVFRKRALRGLANTGLCCIHLPQQWKTLQDEECDEEVEEQRLSKENAPEDELYNKPKENQSFA